MSLTSKTLRQILTYGSARIRPSLLVHRTLRPYSVDVKHKQNKVWTDSTPDLPTTFDPQKAWNWEILVSSRQNPGAMIRRMKYFSQGRQNARQPLDPEEKFAMLSYLRGTVSFALRGGYIPDNDSVIDALQTFINLDGPLDAIKMWLELPDTDIYSPQVLQKVKLTMKVLGQVSKDEKRRKINAQSLYGLQKKLQASQAWTQDKIILFMQLYNIIGTPRRTLWIYRRHRMHDKLPDDLDFHIAAIRACSALGGIYSAKKAFHGIEKAGLIPDERCHAAMIQAYIQVGQSKNARSHYQSIDHSQVVLGDDFYEDLIFNFNQINKPKDVVSIFKDMTSAGYIPSLKALRVVTNIIGEKVQVVSSSETDLVSVPSPSDLLTLVVRQYAMHGQMNQAFATADRAADLEVATVDSNVSYELIAGLCRNGDVLAAESMLQEMKRRGIPMHELAYRTIAKCYVGLRDGYIKITELIDESQSNGQKLSRSLVNMLIQNHVRFRRNQEAIETYTALRSSPEGVDEVTYRILFGAFHSFHRLHQYGGEDIPSPAVPIMPVTIQSNDSIAILPKASAMMTPRDLFSKMHHDLKGFVPTSRYIEAPIRVFFDVHDYPALLAILIYAHARNIQIPELTLLRGISQSLKTGGATKHRRRLSFILKELSKKSESAKPATFIRMVAGLLEPRVNRVILQAARDMKLDLATDIDWIWSRDPTLHDVDVI